MVKIRKNSLFHKWTNLVNDSNFKEVKEPIDVFWYYSFLPFGKAFVTGLNIALTYGFYKIVLLAWETKTWGRFTFSLAFMLIPLVFLLVNWLASLFPEEEEFKLEIEND